jgi:coenzyme F420 biosynthesis associated uncharacterized protein
MSPASAGQRRKSSKNGRGPGLLGAAALTGAALVVRQLARPRAGEHARLIDWDVVRSRAMRGSGQKGPTHLVFGAAELGRKYDRIKDELLPWMDEALGEPLPEGAFPSFTVLDRRAWIDVNLDMFQNLMDPLLRMQEILPASRLTDVGRAGISNYMGALIGFLSRRVLGQYDPVLMAPGVAGPTSLYLVEPNIEVFESKARVRGEPLRQWLVLHEVTHAWEFEAHPWLRDHLNGLIRELIAHRLFTEEKPGRFEVLRALTVGARSQWKAMGQIQATMSLLEGFSNVIMRRVGRAHLSDFDAVDSEFTRRTGQRNPAERAFFRITGLELKMQQYVLGERFCDAVIEAGGMDSLRRVWSGPEALPNMDEVRDPGRWMRRQDKVLQPA